MIYKDTNCAGCGLSRDSVLSVYGDGQKRLLVVFDHQTPIMATARTYGIGFEFDFVKRVLYQYGVIMEEDCWTTSLIQCYTRTPNEKHVECCQSSLNALIRLLKPKVVLFVGQLGAQFLYRHRIAGSLKLDRTHGFIHNWRQHECYAVATDVPGQHGKYSVVPNLIIERDILQAVRALQKPYKAWKTERECIYLCDEKEAIKRLQEAVANDRERWEAFDYETTGLRPYDRGHRLVSCAIASSPDESYAFMMTDKIIPHLRNWLNAPQIKKIAHNLAFELMWSAEKIGTWGRSMRLDTMILAHVFDNRDTRITGIKFLAPMLLGCDLWDGRVASYLESEPNTKRTRGNNALNNIHRVQPRMLLTYNAIDSLVEFRVASVLMPELMNFEITLPTEETVYKINSKWKEL